MPDLATKKPELDDDVELPSTLLFGDSRPRQGKVVAVLPDGMIRAVFPNESMFTGGNPPPMYVTSEPEHFTVVRPARTKLDEAMAEIAALKSRLHEIGNYAAEEGAQRAGHSVAGHAFQRIARLARAGVTE